jgi:hypothetical protein
MGKTFKISSTVPGRNRPEARAHGARWPATRGRSKRWLGHGLAAQPSGATGMCGHRARDDAVACSAVARRRQSVAGDHEGVTGKVPGKEERTGAHQNGGSTVRRCQRRRAAAFVGGEGAPVVAGRGDEVLQLGRVEGVRVLQEISGIGSSGRSSPGSGGRRRCSEAAVRVRGAVGKLGRSREGVREEWGREDESTRERGASGSAAALQRGKKREKGGSRAWWCHAARGLRGA